MAIKRGVVVLSMLACACGADVGSTPARGDASSAGMPSQLAPNEPTPNEPAPHEPEGGKPSGGDTSSAGGSAGRGGSSSEGGRPVAGATSGDAGTGGIAGSSASAGAAGSPGGTAGTGGTPPFDCPDPTGGAHEWIVYTLEPGQCLINGNQSWTGENVCSETTPDDGACHVDCAPFLVVRVGASAEPRRIAVLSLFVETQIVDCE